MTRTVLKLTAGDYINEEWVEKRVELRGAEAPCVRVGRDSRPVLTPSAAEDASEFSGRTRTCKI